MFVLTLCLLGNFSRFLLSTDFFSKLAFSKNSFRNTIKVSHSLDPDLIRVQTVCKNLPADDTSRQRVNHFL